MKLDTVHVAETDCSMPERNATVPVDLVVRMIVNPAKEDLRPPMINMECAPPVEMVQLKLTRFATTDWTRTALVIAARVFTPP
jgi:hypothetical protein